MIPKRSQFPSVFCPLRVRVRLAPPDPSTEVNPWKLPAVKALFLTVTLLYYISLIINKIK